MDVDQPISPIVSILLMYDRIGHEGQHYPLNCVNEKLSVIFLSPLALTVVLLSLYMTWIGDFNFIRRTSMSSRNGQC